MKATLPERAVELDVRPDHIWTDVETYFKQRYAAHAVLTRISRDDKGCNYAAPGSFTITWEWWGPTTEKVELS